MLRMGSMTSYAFNKPQELGRMQDERRTARIAALRENEDPLIAMFRSAGHVVKEG